jgi:hypothetical protein
MRKWCRYPRSSESTEWLIAKYKAIKEGRFPCSNKSVQLNLNILNSEIRRRIPIGTILVWSDKEVRR